MEKVTRNSNIELLRIIAIILVLVIHASFRALGIPTQEEISTSPYSSFLRFFSQSISMVCVNLFILISGWFRINTKPAKVAELIFQVFFYCTLIYIIISLMGITNFSISRWIRLFYLNGSYWFIKAYLFLYILSPLLNLYVENSSQKQMLYFLISFFVFQTVFDCIVDTPWLGAGYSPFSFIGLYLLAQYLRRYSHHKLIKTKAIIYLMIYCSTVLIAPLLSILAPFKMSYYYYYSSPIVIISSLSLFLFFCYLKIQSNIINWIAISSFSVYLVHSCPLIFDIYYIRQIQEWHNSLSLMQFLQKIVLFITCIFIVSILFDKIRIYIWNIICRYVINYVKF